MDRSSWVGVTDWCLARSAHPLCTHPGDERRRLSPQAESPQTNLILRALNDTPPNAPRGRRASSAKLQRPLYPAYPATRSCKYWPAFTPPQWTGFTPPLTVTTPQLRSGLVFAECVAARRCHRRARGSNLRVGIWALARGHPLDGLDGIT
jgi:hypothetical protein